MSAGVFRGAAWVPGLPHLLHAEKSERWLELRHAMEALAVDVAAAKPDVLVVFSSQWVSVLGVSFQAHPNPKGVHVDENWHDLGDLPFDFRVDPAVAARLAAATEAAGMPAKTVAFDEFPIDTGTIVASRLLDPKAKLPLAVVSSWVYADADASRKLGATMRESLEKSGVAAYFVASSLVSARYFTEEIDPAADRLSRPEDDEYNRRWLGLVESGNLEAAGTLLAEMGKRTPVDMQGNAFHWLRGVLGRDDAGRVRAYGPLWGTGAAVIDFSAEGNA